MGRTWRCAWVLGWGPWWAALGCGGSDKPPELPDDLRPPRHGSVPLPTLSKDQRDGDPAPPVHPVTPPTDFGRCLRSRMCEMEGMCSMNAEGQCIAESDEDCKPSHACLGGRCSARLGRCVAASDEDCRSSWACKGWGLCSHDGEGACTATSQDDCAASTRCQREGECTLSAGACVK